VSALRQFPRSAVLVLLLAFAGLTFVAAAPPAGAQTSDQPPTLSDFCTNGVCDFSGYSAALAEFLNRDNGGNGGATEATGTLPVTGGDAGLLLGIGISLVLVGGTVVWTVNHRRPRLEGGH